MSEVIRKVYAIMRDCGDGSATIDMCESKALADYLMSEERAETLSEFEYYLSEGSYLEIPTVGLEDCQILKVSDLDTEDMLNYKSYLLSYKEDN